MPDEDSREISRDDASAEEPRAAEAAADGTEEPIDFLELGHGRREVLVRLSHHPRTNDLENRSNLENPDCRSQKDDLFGPR